MTKDYNLLNFNNYNHQCDCFSSSQYENGYYLIAKVTEIASKKYRQIRLNDSLRFDCSFSIAILKLDDTYVFHVESSKPNIPAIDKIIYNVNNKQWFI